MILEDLFLKEFIVLVPEIFLGLCILYLILHGAIISTIRSYPLIQSSIIYLSILSSCFVIVLLTNDTSYIASFLVFNNSIISDNLSLVSKLTISISSIICLLIIKNFVKIQKLNSFEYIIFILFSVLGLLILCSANDLLTAYLAIELQSLAFYSMASFKKDSTFSVEAGIKYFILGSFSSSLFLFGSSILYLIVGSLNFDDFKDLFYWVYPGNPLILTDIDTYYKTQNRYDLLIALGSKFRFSPHLPLLSREYNLLIDEYFETNFDTITLKEKHSKVALYSDFLLNYTNYDEFNKGLTGNSPTYPMYTQKCTEGLFYYLVLYTDITQNPADLCAFSVLDYSNIVIVTFLHVILKISLSSQIYYPDLQDYEIFSQYQTTEVVQIALVFIFISLFFKLSIAPFHTWSPDVYENSPTSSTIFFVILPKFGIFVLFLRLFVYSFLGFLESWRHILVFLAVISVIIGALAGIEQRKIKSLFAYSSITHIGYLLMSFSTGTLEGVQMVFLYLLVYILSNLCVWFIFIILQVKTSYLKKQNKDLTDFVLLNKSNGILAIILTTALLSIAGIPPMIGFLAKFGIFLSIIEASMYMAAILAILASVVSTFYYLRIIKIVFFEKLLVGKLYYPIKQEPVIFLSFFFYLFFYLFLDPSMLYLISYKTSISFFL